MASEGGFAINLDEEEDAEYLSTPAHQDDSTEYRRDAKRSRESLRRDEPVPKRNNKYTLEDASNDFLTIY